MEVAPASTAPVKRVAKAIVAEHLGLDFTDKVRPRAGYSLHALYCVSDKTWERCRWNTLPAGVSATPSWTRWSHGSVRENKMASEDTLERFHALVRHSSCRIRRIQSAYSRKPVAAALVKAGDSPRTSCTNSV